jgi:hypothetical protein
MRHSVRGMLTAVQSAQRTASEIQTGGHQAPGDGPNPPANNTTTNNA